MNGGAPLLAVASLAVRLSTPRGVVHPLCGVSFGVHAGETLAVVGESGSGKSMLCRTLMGILPRSAKIDAHARIQYNGTELTGLSEARYNGIRGREIAMVFQDPGAALNPVMPIGRQVAEPLRVHLKLTAARARRQVMDLLREVEIPDPGRLMDHYPHQLSGGMRQRVAMAMALACEPRLLIADEPTTALDVTVQESLLDLMERFQARRKMAVILVSHDLRLAALRAGRVAVMYAGRIVEEIAADALFSDARMPYTRALIGAVPRLDGGTHEIPAPIHGQPPAMTTPICGCAFAPRCPAARERCRTEVPPLTAAREDRIHRYACWYPALPEVGAGSWEVDGRRNRS